MAAILTLKGITTFSIHAALVAGWFLLGGAAGELCLAVWLLLFVATSRDQLSGPMGLAVLTAMAAHLPVTIYLLRIEIVSGSLAAIAAAILIAASVAAQATRLSRRLRDARRGLHGKMPADDRTEPDFAAAALSYFRAQVGEGAMQRIDGIACNSPLPRFWFWRIRLDRMVARGQLARKATRSYWPSCYGMPAYGLPHEKWVSK